jgi:xylulokinase
VTTEKDLVIAVDSSTTSCKAIAWNAEGKAVAESRTTYATLSPQPNWYEQNAEDWWRSLCLVLQELMLHISADRVASLCITMQRESFVPVDEQGKPFRNAILWVDGRAWQQVGELDRLVGNDYLHELTGKGPGTTQSLPKFIWLQQYEPDVLRTAYRLLDTHAFLVLRLTGRWATSLPCADPMGVVDMRRGVWATELLNKLNINPDLFVEIVPPGSIIGEVTPDAAMQTGLLVGTPVIAGSGDGQSAGLGANITRPDRAYLNLGTAVVSGVHSDQYVADRAFRTLCSPIPGAYVPEGLLNGGTFTISWYVDKFGPDLSGVNLPVSSEDVLEAAARRLPPGSQGLMLVPYWRGVMPPYWDPAATGITIGWTGTHGREHFYRALLEGIAFEYRMTLEGMSRATGTPLTEIRLMGGGSRSDLWCQIVADITGKPVMRAGTAEATNLGAGILAAAAAGWYPSILAAADAMTTTGRVFEPDGATQAVYDRLYREVYVHLFPALQPYLDKLTELSQASFVKK